jgi:hypothetical protein
MSDVHRPQLSLALRRKARDGAGIDSSALSVAAAYAPPSWRRTKRGAGLRSGRRHREHKQSVEVIGLTGGPNESIKVGQMRLTNALLRKESETRCPRHAFSRPTKWRPLGSRTERQTRS